MGTALINFATWLKNLQALQKCVTSTKQRQTGCTLRLLRLTRNMERSYQMRFCHRIVNDYLGVIAHRLSLPLYSGGNDIFCLSFLIPLSLSKQKYEGNPCLVNSTTAFKYGVCKRPRFAHHIIWRFCTV